ncbi:DUF4465 domain-containing protein [Gaetbulibacter saemankumensis]|uniref:DUF4465 domain-containing protein n=1 Tax=Gaetbulibacter saemankumensis TaxID=311208 RepID=UPI00040EFCB7|nr:DUF4465 domain-containing protein [Gaetbulibacter saemankumensis]
MKFKHTNILKVLFVAGFLSIFSCEDKLDVIIPEPNDVNFNELALGRFTYNIPQESIKSGAVTANVVNNGNGDFSGFALSNKSWRSYPWSLSPDFAPTNLSPEDRQAAIDSCIFSAYTFYVNRTENYLVGHAKDDNAFITLDRPTVVEHVLVANNTYNYLLQKYGSVYSGTFDQTTQAYLIDGNPVSNRNIADRTVKGRFYLPGPNDVSVVHIKGHQELERRETGNPNLATGYLKLIIEGSLNGTPTGTVDFYLSANPETDPQNPEYNFVADDWLAVDLTSLGEVDKVLFKMETSYVDDQGNMLYAPYFCLDGIRLKQ